MDKIYVTTIDEEFEKALKKAESVEEVAKNIIKQMVSDKAKPSETWAYIDSHTSHVHENLKIGERTILNQEISDAVRKIRARERKQVWTRTRRGKIETVHRRKNIILRRPKQVKIPKA